MQKTFVAEEGKDRKKARLSWYHPDDTVSCCTSHFPLPAQGTCTVRQHHIIVICSSISSSALKDPTTHVVQQSQEL